MRVSTDTGGKFCDPLCRIALIYMIIAMLFYLLHLWKLGEGMYESDAHILGTVCFLALMQ